MSTVSNHLRALKDRQRCTTACMILGLFTFAGALLSIRRSHTMPVAICIICAEIIALGTCVTGVTLTRARIATRKGVPFATAMNITITSSLACGTDETAVTCVTGVTGVTFA